MRSLYGNSFVNLAASSDTNVYGSIFSIPDHFSGGFYARVGVTTSESCTVRKFESDQVYKDSVGGGAGRGHSSPHGLGPFKRDSSQPALFTQATAASSGNAGLGPDLNSYPMGFLAWVGVIPFSQRARDGAGLTFLSNIPAPA
jgi:hypothetical protein